MLIARLHEYEGYRAGAKISHTVTVRWADAGMGGGTMPPNPRFDEPGCLHHVMNPGIARRTVFETRGYGVG